MRRSNGVFFEQGPFDSLGFTSVRPSQGGVFFGGGAQWSSSGGVAILKFRPKAWIRNSYKTVSSLTRVLTA